ncbi:class I SAM-dependent methyltransferase [Pseudoteredinibacter isoporae]|uniref:Putative methyltransferase n=1 Tax=Pseudoteredinibacter isoporae TaxID=570281 RepID=A0A7X0MWD1_9GAMM|nr:class I SAM-dependent methyltransferase [Pseudoteredinibacter isoporae]MBB6522348.1 putative methyltransferase [Pseudoteredinibacter isoporae]NHO87881.1 class I SAM-dependent methyltransferase [Pseudoteredinibacter isoporae]NIB23788.1 class I SAM-dependent methyltransferase [Pseudoteredinibacter isoporae]
MFAAKPIISTVVLALSVGFSAQSISHANHSIEKSAAAEHRSAKNSARDPYRNPIQTLEFFEVEEDQAVVEIWPGGGWYAEILAPYLMDKGTYYAAHFDPNAGIDFYTRYQKKFVEKMQANPEVYGKAELTAFYPPNKVNTIKGSADRVLTFRNVHNWMKSGFAQEAFNEFYAMLKPGGILGVVEHRAKPGTDLDTMIKSGYVTEAKVRELAEKAGFKLVAASEINANPNDTADHPKGVWTLPPSLRMGDEKRDHYKAIGESDRMTLKFVKPAK